MRRDLLGILAGGMGAVGALLLAVGLGAGPVLLVAATVAFPLAIGVLMRPRPAHRTEDAWWWWP